MRALSERTLSVEEFRAWADGPIGDEERRGIEELIAWYTKRYPTAAQRLAHARIAQRRWARSFPRERSGEGDR
ncbi:MAG: hypothetical protein M3Y87_16820 [Myxococcota bacterium]|nr:hypothetical protein [Myxococcota bacterium]